MQIRSEPVIDEHATPQDHKPRSLLEALRDLWGELDALIGVLLTLLLLPLILGPAIAVFQFLEAGQLVEAGAVAVLAAACYAVALRAVRRGEFGPSTAATVFAIGALILSVVVRFR